MSKNILGDDPFGTGATPAGEAAPPKEANRKSKAKPKKPASAKPPSAPTTETEAATSAIPTPESDFIDVEVDDAPASAGPGVDSDSYGPSIDHEPSLPERLREEVNHIEERVLERLHLRRPERHPGDGAARQPLPLEFFWRRWSKLAMRDRSDVVDEFGRDPNVAAKMEPLLEFLYHNYFRVQASGLGHIPDTGRGLIVANHSGTLPYDGAMIMHAIKHESPTGRSMRPLAEDFVFYMPYLGVLMNRIGAVRACPENAERLLNQDQLVAVFPEGIKGIGKLWRERYRLQRFGRGGFIKIALRTGSPIIPTAVVGAEEIHPMLTKISWLAKSFGIPYLPITPTFPLLGPLGLVPLPSKWYLAFGEPLYFHSEYGPDAADDRILVNKLAEQVRQKIQEMIDALLKQRKSVLFG